MSDSPAPSPSTPAAQATRAIAHEIDQIRPVRRTFWTIAGKLTSDPAPQDLARLDKAVDWIGADHRALVSKVPVSAMGSRTSSCTFPDLVARLIRGD